ncbi:MAG: hypothetical protein ACRDOI_14490 [Trebonia sp.]
MADVPLAAVIISTVSTVVAGGLPLVIGWIRDTGREKREAAERLATERLRLAQEKRGECVTLLGLARNYRVLVENAADSSGSDLVAYAREIRRSAVDITGQADEVGFMMPAAETTASSLAAEAHLLAVVIADKRNRELGEAVFSPDFARFDLCLAEFKAAAQVALGDRPTVTAGGAVGVESGECPRLQTATGRA